MVFALPSCPNFPQCLLYCDLEVECFYSLRIKAQCFLAVEEREPEYTASAFCPQNHFPSPSCNCFYGSFLCPNFRMLPHHWWTVSQSHKNFTWHFSSHKYSESFQKNFFSFCKKEHFFWGRVSRSPGWPRIHSWPCTSCLYLLVLRLQVWATILYWCGGWAWTQGSVHLLQT